MPDAPFSKSWNSRHVLLGVKLALVAVHLLATNRMLWVRIDAIGLQAGLLVFMALWITCIGAFVALALYGRPLARVFWSLLFFASSTLNLGYVLVASRFMGLPEFEQLLGLVAFAGNLSGFHDREIVVAAAWSLLGLVALNMPPWLDPARLRHPLPRLALQHAGLLQLLPIAMIAALLHLRGGEGSHGLAGQYKKAAYASMLGAERALAPPPPERLPPALPRAVDQPFRHVVLVMDESIRGDYLDVNVPGGVPTGLRSLAAQMANFGVAASASNCSAPSNALVRFGATRADHARDLARNPSLWDYARHAGYRAVYLDGQRQDGGLHNLMDGDERSRIDDFVQLEGKIDPAQRDHRLGRILRTHLDLATPSFVFVNKSGCHFPYEGKYPAGETRYRPVMARTYFGEEADPDGVAPPATRGDPDYARLVNSYRNCVAWNTRRFFDAAFPGGIAEDVIVLYTADHGQNFHEDGSPGTHTHCTHGPASASEGRVPLLALTGHPRTLARLQAAASLNRDRASHFNLYPSLLALMGLDTDAAPGHALAAGLETPMAVENGQFLSTFQVRYGKAPVWSSIGTPGERRDGLAHLEAIQQDGPVHVPGEAH